MKALPGGDVAPIEGEYEAPGEYRENGSARDRTPDNHVWNLCDQVGWKCAICGMQRPSMNAVVPSCAGLYKVKGFDWKHYSQIVRIRQL